MSQVPPRFRPRGGKTGNPLGRRRPNATTFCASGKQIVTPQLRVAASHRHQLQQKPWERSVFWQHPAAARGSPAAPLHVYAPVQEPSSSSSRPGSNGSASPSSRDASPSTSSNGSSRSSETTLTPSEGSGLPVLSLSTPQSGRELVPTTSSSQILAPVSADMQILSENLQNLVGKRHPLLMAAAHQIFGAGGKKLRPAIVLLCARATKEVRGLSDITPQHRRLAEITEMIHTASLVHDDVVDNCSIRRGKTTVNSLYGTRVAVLAGDYLFAQSSWHLAQLDNLEVIKLISQVIADFADGEIGQQARHYDTTLTIPEYMDKSFYKTATLIAASCKSAAVFSGLSQQDKDSMFEYGRHLGLAFQVVDDILDFTQTAEQLGKPKGQDLATGNLTAPAVYALQTAVGPELDRLIKGGFSEDETGTNLQQALHLVAISGGIDRSRELARQEADMALACLQFLPESKAKQSLELMVDYVLDRLY